MLSGLTIAGPDYLAKISRGTIPGALPFFIHGYNADVDNVREDLIETGGVYVFPSDAGEAMRVVSNNAGDAAAGAGARTVDVHYLDSNGDEGHVNITLNGVNPVAVPVNIRRVNYFHVETVGANGAPLGTVQLQNAAGTVVFSQISPGFNQARMAIYTVPRAMRAFVSSWNIGVGNQTGNRMIEAYLHCTSTVEGLLTPGVFLAKDIVVLIDGAIDLPFEMPLLLPELCDVKVSVQSDNAAANAITGGGFHGWIEPA